MLERREIPDDLEACQQLAAELLEAYDHLQRVHEELLATCTSIQENHAQLEQEKEELQHTIQELMQRLYGRRSERHKDSPGQLPLEFVKDELPIEVLPEVADDFEFVTNHQNKRRKRRRKKHKGRFPEHLERRVRRIEPQLPDGLRPEDCQLLGVDVVETLEFGRPELWVQVLEYPKYVIPDRPDLNVVQGPREVNLVPGGSFGFGIAAEVLHNKFALHVPLYRQQDPFAELGWAPSRSTLGQIVIASAEVLRPLVDLLRLRVLQASVLNTDDTPVTLLTPGVDKGSRKARFWIYRSNQPGSLYDVFAFTDSRARAGPDAFLEDFCGTLCGDCYSGYVNVEARTKGRIIFSACNTHARRYVHNAREQDPGLSSQILALYRELYDIEERGSRMDPAMRLQLRQRESAPLMVQIQVLLHSPAALELLPKSKLGSALNYMRNNWEALTRFLSDGRVPIDNNEAEAALRRVAVGRKNWLFVGSEQGGERAATILSVVASAHRHDLDVWAYLRDVLERLARGDCEVEQLLPDVWKQNHPEHVRTFRSQEREHRADDRRYRHAQRRIADKAAAAAVTCQAQA